MALWMRIGTILSAIFLAIIVPNASRAAALSNEDTVALAQNCAPTVGASVLAAVARVESRFDPLALRNNSKHLSMSFSSPAVSVELAKAWISKGDSVDLGLMQINSGNLTSLGLTIDDAFDPCRSLEAGARVLSAAYNQDASLAEREAALLIALSRYNTGQSLAGLANGYVGEVLAAQNNAAKAKPISSKPADTRRPGWDVWAAASTARHHGAAWLIGSQDTHDFLIGAGARPKAGDPHALSQVPDSASGM